MARSVEPVRTKREIYTLLYDAVITELTDIHIDSDIISHGFFRWQDYIVIKSFRPLDRSLFMDRLKH